MQSDFAANSTTELTARPGISRVATRLIARYQTLVRYAVIGSFGYVVYVGLLALMYDLALVPILPAKGSDIDLGVVTHGDSLFLLTTLVGTQASIVAVFAGHSHWTFASHETQGKSAWRRFLQFEARALVSTLGILTLTVNVAVLSGLHHYVAVPLSIATTFTWNWFWDSKVIWRRNGASS